MTTIPSQDRPLNALETGEYLHLRPSTLATWRRLGYGPRYYRVGVRCVYRLEDLNEWLDDECIEEPGE